MSLLYLDIIATIYYRERPYYEHQKFFAII